MVVATFALGLGSVTTVATVARAVFLDSLPFAEADRLVFLRESTAQSPRRWVAWKNFLDWRERQKVFEEMAAHAHHRVTLTGGDRPESAVAVLTSASLFPMLDARATAGRLFDEEDDHPGAASVVVLAHQFWQKHYGGRESAIGEALEIAGEHHQIIGVLEAGFLYPRDFRDVSLYLPIGQASEEWDRRAETHPGLSVSAKLGEGIQIEVARDEMNAIAAVLANEHPETNRGHGIYMISLRERVVGDLDQPLFALAGASLLVLLLAAVSIANLELARAAERRSERALRHALGAPLWRLTAFQVLDEIALAVVGGVAGWGLAGLLLAAARRLVDLESFGAVGPLVLDGRSAALAMVIALSTGMFVGMVPALAGWRGVVAGDLPGSASRTSPGRSRQQIRRRLAATQLALALALSLLATLALGSLVSLFEAHPGFESRSVLSFAVTLPEGLYDEEEPRRGFYDHLVERLESLPEVTVASTAAPFLTGWSTAFEARGQEHEEGAVAEMLRVGPSYFDVLGIDIIEGRTFQAGDVRTTEEGTQGAAIVGERFAETVWPGETAVGQRLRLATDPPGSWRRVVAVVRHVKNRGVQRESQIQLYLPLAEAPEAWAYAAVRTTGDPMVIADAVEPLVGQLESGALVEEIQRLESRVAAERNGPRLLAACLAFFAAVTLMISVLGVYAVMVASVTGRRRELGVRLALGARPHELSLLVLREVFGLTVAGIVGGLILGTVGSRWLAHQLYGIQVNEPWVWLSIPLMLAAVTLLAALPTARRAGRFDPSALLHDDRDVVW